MIALYSADGRSLARIPAALAGSTVVSTDRWDQFERAIPHRGLLDRRRGVAAEQSGVSAAHVAEGALPTAADRPRHEQGCGQCAGPPERSCRKGRVAFGGSRIQDVAKRFGPVTTCRGEEISMSTIKRWRQSVAVLA